MRDDIHKAAPISRALQAVLKHALRPADRLRPRMLSDMAAEALFRDLRFQITPSLLKELNVEVQGRGLFSPVELAGPAPTRLQADVAAHLSAFPNSSLEKAIRTAAAAYVQVLSNESEAAMLAAGGNRWDVLPGVRAFESALLAAVPAAASLCIDSGSVELVSHQVTLKETLAVGPKARRAPN